MIDTWQQIVIWTIGIAMTLTAVRVVTAQNVVHAALYLVGTLLGAASIYIMLLAEFVAWAQVLIYVGAIVVLMLFGLMLTRAPIGKTNFDNDQRLIAALCAAAVFGVTSYIMWDAFKDEKINFAR
ncbi:MAG: NADH-quinone oxidoreductase subunit J, partial [Actinomycetota bacterium]|nr:NADH-quinone oxidoreductase subunit J [Actinomycetota bacterium]